MSEKIMLIAGCSHTAGSEIDGELDSALNRSLSYGNILAKKLGYTPINIAIGGSTNGAIVRSVLDWFQNHDITNKEIFVLIGWTESTRVDAPFQYPTWHEKAGAKFADWVSPSMSNFLHINLTFKGYTEREKDIQEDYQSFIVKRTEFFEVYSANLALELQFFLKHINVKYLMVNTMHMFSKSNEQYLKSYLSMIDNKHYYNALNNEESFYTKYKDSKYNAYRNPKTVYGHHGAEPHRLYAEELYNYITETQ
jgi:hypothetical protein